MLRFLLRLHCACTVAHASATEAIGRMRKLSTVDIDLRHKKAVQLTKCAEQTFQKLFQAQRFTHSHQSPIPSQAQPIPATSTSSPRQTQASLHKFWHLPQSRNMSQAFVSMAPTFVLQPKCEDCDALLCSEDDSEMDIDCRDPDLRSQHSCQYCRRQVCDGCAVVYLDEGKICLQCKTSQRRWIGGLG